MYTIIVVRRKMSTIIFVMFYIKIKGVRFNPLGQVLFIWFIVIFFILTFLGACPAEGIYLKLGILYSKNYFI